MTKATLLLIVLAAMWFRVMVLLFSGPRRSGTLKDHLESLGYVPRKSDGLLVPPEYKDT